MSAEEECNCEQALRLRADLARVTEERDLLQAKVDAEADPSDGGLFMAAFTARRERDEAREVLRYVRGWLEGADHSFKCPLVSDLYGDDAFCVRCSQIERIDRALANGKDGDV